MELYPYQTKKLQKLRADYGSDLNEVLDLAIETLETITDLQSKGAIKFFGLVPIDDNANVVEEANAVQLAPIPLELSCVSSFRSVTYEDGEPIILPFINKPKA